MKKFIVFCLIFSCLLCQNPLIKKETPCEEETIEITENIEIKEEIKDNKKIDIPHYYQQDYICAYGHYGTVSTHGCGITSLAMALSALLDEDITPDILAQKYGRFNTEHGSSWGLFPEVCNDYHIQCEKIHYKPERIIEELKNNKLIISNQRKGLFTQGGHYILLTGINEEGLIMVNDPNIYNYENKFLLQKFEEGFMLKEITQSSSAYWIIG